MNVLACFVASNLFFTRRVSSASPVSVQTRCEVYSPIVVFFFFKGSKEYESGEGDQTTSYLKSTSVAGLNVIRHLQENSLCQLALRYLVEVSSFVELYNGCFVLANRVIEQRHRSIQLEVEI